ncbi:MAG: CarD family transcriptional regulator [Rhizobiales bacterium]|nr:CarD family transcriptional regulator [Hyphomicrobiales bacterium]
MTKPKEKLAAAKAAKSAAPAKSAPAKSAPAKRAMPAAEKAPVRKAPATKPVETAKSKPVAAQAAAAKPAPAKTAPAKAAAAKPAPAKAAAPKPAPAAKPALAKKPEAAVAAPAKPASAPAKAPVVAAKPAEAPVAKKAPVKTDFKTGEYIVYPAHGVGRIVGIDAQEVAGLKLDLFVISFLKDKMTLRVPTTKATAVGMRKLADPNTVKRALETVRGRARVKRTMWSRRAQEYEAKINSGDLISIAEVVRDLFRSENQPEQSYSERQLYEAALDRMSREISSVNRISETEAIRQIEQNLAKSPRRGPKPEGEEAAQDKAA